MPSYRAVFGRPEAHEFLFGIFGKSRTNMVAAIDDLGSLDTLAIVRAD
jgi:hypothetical protein